MLETKTGVKQVIILSCMQVRYYVTVTIILVLIPVTVFCFTVYSIHFDPQYHIHVSLHIRDCLRAQVPFTYFNSVAKHPIVSSVMRI